MTAPRWLTPDTLTGDTTCRQFAIPLELLPMVRGAVDMLAQPWNWEEFGTATIDEVVAASQILSEALSEECNMGTSPDRLHLSWQEGTFTPGGSVTPVWQAADNENGGWWQTGSAAAINDKIVWLSNLAAGTYKFKLSHGKNTNAGIWQLYVDEVHISDVDEYASVANTNAMDYFSDVTIDTDGQHEIKLVTTTKNASSSGYRIRFCRLYVHRV